MADETLEKNLSNRKDQPTISIRIGQRIALTILMNAVFLWFIYSLALGDVQVSTPGNEWIVIIIVVIALVGLDMVVVPQIFRHYIRFEDTYLEIAIGFHTAKIRYSDILTVTNRISPIVKQWYAIAPGGIQIHATVFDEVVAVANEELLFEELSRRNPNIKITRSRISA